MLLLAGLYELDLCSDWAMNILYCTVYCTVLYFSWKITLMIIWMSSNRHLLLAIHFHAVQAIGGNSLLNITITLLYFVLWTICKLFCPNVQVNMSNNFLKNVMRYCFVANCPIHVVRTVLALPSSGNNLLTWNPGLLCPTCCCNLKYGGYTATSNMIHANWNTVCNMIHATCNITTVYNNLQQNRAHITVHLEM